jgi:hypothetical protein
MNITQFTNGWLVGDFVPSLLRTKDLEVGIKYYKTGDKDLKHYHKETTEYTVVLYGKIKMLNEIWEKNDIIVIKPNIENEFECLVDCCLLVIKTPSMPKDKYII